MFEALDAEVRELTLPIDGTAIATALRLRDQLDARIAAAIGEFDRAELWDLDASTSLIAWLRDHGQRSRRDATRWASMARVLRDLPVTAAAYADGALTGGQADVITTVVGTAHAARFAEIERELIPTLSTLSVDDTKSVMDAWKARAQADGEPVAAEPERSLHLSQTLDGRFVLDGELDPESGKVVRTAVRLAMSPDVDSEPKREPATRRADALVDICRFFLDHQTTQPGGRHRPHLNVVVDLDALEHGRGGRHIDGLPIAGVGLATLLCDSALHRLVVSGRSTILDYGTATRTAPANLWNALVVRDHHCRFPGCDRPAHWCEAHHLNRWEHGGATAIDNLVVCCSRHHHRLHQPGWHAKLRPDGTFEVTDPNGVNRSSQAPGCSSRPAALFDAATP